MFKASRGIEYSEILLPKTAAGSRRSVGDGAARRADAIIDIGDWPDNTARAAGRRREEKLDSGARSALLHAIAHRSNIDDI